MKNLSPLTLAVVASFLTVAFATAALTQTAQTPAAAPVQATADDGGPVVAPPVPVPFAPGFDDLMTMLVQPRHIKLFLAGSTKNWELAAAEARDLRSSFGRVAQTVPTYEGNDVSLAMANFVVSRMDAVDAAIAAADSEKFASAYKNLTGGCNECHTYMEHPFLVIKNPGGADANSAHADQDFNPPP